MKKSDTNTTTQQPHRQRNTFMDKQAGRSAAAAANNNSNSSRKRRSNKDGGFNDLKVVYISTPMKVRTSASKFREIVQELTGKHSDVASLMESNSTTKQTNLQQDMYWTTLDDDDVANNHSHQTDDHQQQKQISTTADYYNGHHAVAGTSPLLPHKEQSSASSSVTPASAGSGSVMLNYLHQSFDLDDLQAAVCSSSSSSGGDAVCNDLKYDHMLNLVDDRNLFGSSTYSYTEFFPGDAGDQYFRPHHNFELERSIW